jgi:outer membrane protein insertion porin family
MVILFVVLPCDSLMAEDDMPVIKHTEVRGNRKIEKETILANIKSRPGSVLSQKSIQDDIRGLFALGYFDDIRVELEPFEGGVNLVFIVVEKPKIVSLDFQGNEELETEKLREKVTVSPGAIANYFLIKDNVEGIIAHYQAEGYWHVRVIPIIREVSDDEVAVTFQIDEGPKVKVKKVTFEGNKSISAKKIKKVMRTKKWWLFSFITGSGVYREEVLKYDLEKIKELYHSKGFIQVKISEPEVTVSPDRKKLNIHVSLDEGEQFTVADVEFSGNSLYGSAELYGHVETAPGAIFNRTAMKKDIDAILQLYTERGYAMADVDPLVQIEAKEKRVNVTFSIQEGEIFRIGRIEVIGNEKTRDKVIRREVRLDEGDVYNSKLIKRSYQRINNLNFFDSVDLNPKPRVREKIVDLDVRVKEKLTGMISVGGGYSSIDKFIVTGEITQTNLFGKGLYLRLKADLSALRANYYIKVTNPWFMDRPIAATVTVFNESFEFPSYDKEATGGSVGFGKELSEYVRGNITYKLENVDITDVDEDASSVIKDQEGEKLTSSVDLSVWRDSRDNYLDPTTGSKNGLYTTFAGIGGDNYFIKGLYDSLWYFPFKWGTVFSFRGRVGYATGFAGKSLPLYERFYVGGIDTVRGLGFGEGGPRDDNGEEIGGTRELIFNAEYIFPLVEDIKLKGLVFFDAGKSEDSWEDVLDLRTTTGFGLRWHSPFGPIRLEWGYNIDKRDDEASSKIEFALGGVF